MKRKTVLFCTGAAIVLVAAACATSPTGRTQLMLVSGDEMNAMGAEAFEQLKENSKVMPEGSAHHRYVSCISNAITSQIAPDTDWEVRTFDEDAVNAFALPGGKIGVYRGIIEVAETQDQLAAVIGHEIGHVLAQHSAARVSNQLATELGVAVLAGTTGTNPQLIGMGAQLLLLMPYGRRDESEADILGLDYMARSGFDPTGAPALWVNMARASEGSPPEFMSTHPSHERRIRDLQENIPKVQPLYDQARAQGRRPNCRRPS